MSGADGAGGASGASGADSASGAGADGGNGAGGGANGGNGADGGAAGGGGGGGGAAGGGGGGGGGGADGGSGGGGSADGGRGRGGGADGGNGGGAGGGGRPFRVLGVQQIAIGGESKAALRALWVDLLGVPVTGTFRSERENVDEDILTLAGVEIDLMQPIDPARSPRVHEPRLNHVGLWVDDLAAAVAWLTAQGVRFTPGGIRRGAAGHDVCFIHPKGDAANPRGGEGVLIELVQAPDDVIGELGGERGDR